MLAFLDAIVYDARTKKRMLAMDKSDVEGTAQGGSEEKEPSGKQKGGVARAEKLSPERRSAIAKEAAEARWKDRPVSSNQHMPKALPDFVGVLKIAGVNIPCAVIEGPNGIQRVITEHGITQAILGTRSGASKRLKKAAQESGTLLPLFLAPRQLTPFIDEALLDGPLAPIDYLDGDRVVRGYDASVLPAVCKVWLKAREAGALQAQQLAKAQKAEILTTALAELGIVALVDEATGYEKVRPQNALQAYLEMVISRELASWVKRFPDEFYENIYRLKGWPWPGMGKNRYSVVGKYTRSLVYERLGPGILKELEEKSPRTDNGRRRNKLHQWLTGDVGHPMLSQHLHSLIVLQRLALSNGAGWTKFVNMVDQTLPKRGNTLELPLPDPTE